MNKNPLVSAIIPTYNRAHIIGEAVESALSQTYPNMEVIIVDDGSKDDTLERLAQFGDRIRVLKQANAGPAAARNTGVGAARGELIAFLDSDDIWLPNKTARQVSLLQRSGGTVPCCLSNILMKWNSGDRTSFDIAWLRPGIEEGLWLNVAEVLATRTVLFNQGIMIRREVIEKIGGFDTSIRYLEDVEYPLRLSLEGHWAFINTPLVIWRESMTNSVYKNAVRDELCTNECMVKVLETHLARIGKINGSARLSGFVNGELKRARRQLWLSKLRGGSSGKKAIASSVQMIEHYRGALYRRSPWYPQMEVVAVEPGGQLEPAPRGDAGIPVRS